MLRTNLSTRPFYNEHAVRTALLALAALAIGLTLFNAYEIIQLRAQNSNSSDTVARNDAEARALRSKATVVRQSIDAVRLQAVQAAANEANGLIDLRTFSWTDLLNQFQATLPPDVRIAGVQPQRDESGRRLVQVSVLSRRIEDLEDFMAALEKTGVFSEVLSRSDRSEDDGSLRSELQAYYTPRAAGSPAPASESGKPPQNGTPSNQSAAALPASRGER